MSKVSKKLLSLLIVMAMVAAMVPATGLPVAATDGSTGNGAAAAAPVEIDNSNLTLVDGKADCPVCHTEVTWTPITEAVKITTSGHYYLPASLAGDSALAYQYLEIVDADVCLHLNGNSLISTNVRAIRHRSGTLNIMGNGTVSGTYASVAGSALEVAGSAEVNLYGGTYVKDWADTEGNALSTVGVAPVVYMTGGTINMYKGATIDGSNCSSSTKSAVYLMGTETTPVEFNMFGGTIENGESEKGGNVYVGSYSTLNMSGGTIAGGKATDGGNVYVYEAGGFEMSGGTISGGNVTGTGGNIYTYKTDVTVSGTAKITGGTAGSLGGNIHFNGINHAYKLTVTGGTIEKGTANGTADTYTNISGATGNIYIPNGQLDIQGGTIAGDIVVRWTSSTVTVSGTPVITKGNAVGLASNAKLTLGTLSEGASIGIWVKSYGAFTVANENAANYAQYFHSADDTNIYNIKAKDDNILYAYSVTDNLTDSDEATEGMQALCPVCGTVETWTPITEATKITTSGHWYLPASFTGQSTKLYQFLEVWGGTVCLHLNGKDLIPTSATNGTTTSASVRAIRHYSGTLNIMGNGTVSGTYAGEVGNALQMQGGVANLYGGTYVRSWADESGAPLATVQTGPVIYSEAGTINMYRGATVDGSTYASSGSLATVLMSGTKTAAFTFNVYGGTIKDGNSSNGGNVHIKNANAKFVMHGGTVTGGTATNGGNIYASTGEVTIGANATVTLGEAVTGGNIYVLGATVTTSGTISNGTATGTASSNGGGNVYVGSNATLSITGGQISGGNSGATSAKGGSILAMGADASKVAKIVMTGGTISGGTAANASGHNIYLYFGNMTMTGGEIVAKDLNGVHGSAVRMTQGVMNLGGDATVSTNMSNGDIQLYNDADRVHILQDWSGSANVRLRADYVAGSEVATANAQCGTLASDGTFTAADVAYTGTLMNTRGDYLPILCSTADSAAGTLYVAGSSLVDAENNEVYYATNADAVNDYEDGSVIKLHTADALVLNGADYYVDLNGNANVAISGSGTLHGVDTANDDFSGYGFATVADANEDGVPDVTVADDAYLGENRYIMLKQTDGSYEFHRLIMAIDTVSLDTNVCGYFYKTTFQCDETLASRISGYGIAVSKIDVPGVDFATEEHLDTGKLQNSWTDLTVDAEDYASFKEGIVSNSLRVTGIMKTDRYETDAENKAANIEQAQKALFANAHITIDQNGDDTKQVAFVCYTEEDVAAGEVGASMTLVDVIDALDETYTSYGDTVKEWIDTFYGKWADLGMADLAEIAGKDAWTNLGNA